MKVTWTCVICGLAVTKHRSIGNMATAPKYCGQKCHGLALRGTGGGLQTNVKFDCENCGVHVDAYRSPAARLACPPRFCSLSCLGEAQIGAGNPSYSGGRYESQDGYVHVLMPDSADADCRGYVLEHRLVMANELRRSLADEEVVHHLNEIRNDNDPGNLVLCANQSEHMRLYHAGR